MKLSHSETLQLKNVENYLSQHGLRVLNFDEHTPDSKTAARAVGCSVTEIIKSILVKVGNTPVLVVTCGDAKLNSSRLKRTAGLSGQVRFAAPDEVKRYTGYAPGGVTPFLLPEDLPVYLDSSMRRFSTVYPAAGNDHSAVPITPDQLLELTGGIEADICDLRD